MSSSSSWVDKIASQIEGYDNALKELNDSTNKNLNLVGERFKKIGTGLNTAISVPIKNLGVSAVNMGMEFEAAMTKVGVATGASGENLAALEEKAKNLGKSTQFSSSEVAGAFLAMANAGWETNDMLTGIDGVMSLASASGTALASVSSTVKEGLSAFGLSAQDSSRYADALAAASTGANTNISVLGESLKTVAPAAGSLGFSVEDTSKALALMGQAGIQGSQAGDALLSMMTNLKEPTDAAKAVMEKFNLSLENNDGSMKSLDQVMSDLRGAFGGLDESQQKAYASTLFGQDAMEGALAIINASEDDYLNLSNAMNESEGAAKSMGDAMNDNLAGRLESVKSSFEEIGIAIYKRLQPALEILVDFGKRVADAFSGLHPHIQIFIFVLAGLVAVIGPILLGIGTMMMLFNQLSAACTTLSITMSAAFWWVIAIIAALAAIVAVVVYWEEIKAFFIEFFETLKLTFMEAWETIKTVFFEVCEVIKEYLILVWQSILETIVSVWNTIVEFFLSIWTGICAFVALFAESLTNILINAWTFITEVTTSAWNWIKEMLIIVWNAILTGISVIVQNISNYLTSMWNVIATTASTVWNWIKSILINTWNAIKTASLSVWNTIKNTMITTWDTIKSTASSVWNGLKTTIMTPVNLIKDQVASAFEGMKSTALNAWEGLKSGMKSVINGVISMINRFINSFNSPAKLLNKIPNVDVPQIPTIPMLASGGKMFGSGYAIVGEAGPELVQKSGSSVKVTPLSSQEKNAGIGGALGVNSSVNLNNMSARINIGGYEAKGLIEFITGQQMDMKNRAKRQLRGGFA